MVIASVGTAGATTVSSGSEQGGTILQVASAAGFAAGQAITIGAGVDAEDAVVKAAQGGRGGGRITVVAPLGRAYAAGTQVAGSGITLGAPLNRAHPAGAPVTAELPTPGAANAYSRSRR